MEPRGAPSADRTVVPPGRDGTLRRRPHARCWPIEDVLSLLPPLREEVRGLIHGTLEPLRFVLPQILFLDNSAMSSLCGSSFSNAIIEVASSRPFGMRRGQSRDHDQHKTLRVQGCPYTAPVG